MSINNLFVSCASCFKLILIIRVNALYCLLRRIRTGLVDGSEEKYLGQIGKVEATECWQSFGLLFIVSLTTVGVLCVEVIKARIHSI